MAFPSIKLSAPATQEFWELEALYEDEHLLAISKPARLLTSPDRYDKDRPNLMKLLHEGIALRKPWAVARGLDYLSNAHRLDFETTGILLLAKNKPMLISLAGLFGSNRPSKVYAALVMGSPAESRFAVDAALAPHPGRPGLMRIDTKKGKKSRTEFEVVERLGAYTLMHCRPITGRTHQIRAHLLSRNLPICGDSLYGGRPLYLSKLKSRYTVKEGKSERPLIQTLALHAERLSFTHPVTGAFVEIHADWPRDLKVAVKYLRRYAVDAPLEQS